MTHDNSFPGKLSNDDLFSGRYGRLATDVATDSAAAKSIPMETFRWIVSGLLGALLVGVGWFLSGVQGDLRDVRKEVTAIRIEAAVTNTKLEELIAEFRRRNPR